MAWEYITATCGHEYREQMYGKQAGRDSRVEYLSRRECPDCYKASQDKAHAAESATARTAAQVSGLPSLDGSERQVAWAETLRGKALQTIRTMVDPTSSPLAPMAYAVLKIYADHIAADTRAKYWIDTREHTPLDWRTKALAHAATRCGLDSHIGLTPKQATMIGEWAMVEVVIMESHQIGAAQ